MAVARFCRILVIIAGGILKRLVGQIRGDQFFSQKLLGRLASQPYPQFTGQFFWRVGRRFAPETWAETEVSPPSLHGKVQSRRLSDCGFIALQVEILFR